MMNKFLFLLLLPVLAFGAIDPLPTTGSVSDIVDKINEVTAEINKISEEATQTKYIRSVADLPTPSGGEHPLEPMTVYHFIGQVVSADALRYPGAGGTIVIGSTTSRDAFIYSGVGAAFRATNTALVVRDLGVVTTDGSASGFDFDGDGTDTFGLDNVGGTLSRFGTVSNPNIFIMEDGLWDLTSSGIELSGSSIGFIALSVTRLNQAGGFTLLNLGTSVAETISITTTIFDTVSGGTAISGAAASANVGTQALVANSQFIGEGNALQGMSTNDLKWTYGNNIGLARSSTRLSAGFENGSTPTTVVSNTDVIIAGNYIATVDNARFNVTAGGVFTAQNIISESVTGILSIGFTKGGSGVDTYIFKMQKQPGGAGGWQDIPLASRSVTVETEGAPTTIPFSTNFINTDQFRVTVQGVNTTDPITATGISIQMGQ